MLTKDEQKTVKAAQDAAFYCPTKNWTWLTGSLVVSFSGIKTPKKVSDLKVEGPPVVWDDAMRTDFNGLVYWDYVDYSRVSIGTLLDFRSEEFVKVWGYGHPKWDTGDIVDICYRRILVNESDSSRKYGGHGHLCGYTQLQGMLVMCDMKETLAQVRKDYSNHKKDMGYHTFNWGPLVVHEMRQKALEAKDLLLSAALG